MSRLATSRLLYEFFEGHPLFWASVLGVGLVFAMALSATIGAVSVPMVELPSALWDPNHPMNPVVSQVRIPRVLCAALVGAALAVAGALFQTVVRNPLADPNLIGVNAGAGLAAILTLILAPEVGYALPFLAFFGAVCALALTLGASWIGANTASSLRIILSGVAVQAVLAAGIALLVFFFADRAPAFVGFIVGSLNSAGWRDVTISAVPTLVGTLLALGSTRWLNLLLLDDDSAAGVGLGVTQARILACGVGALLAAGAVSIAGLVGFVGLVVPNAVRIVSGPHHARLIPLCALGGALLVVVADTFARTVAAPLELPVGALLAFVGGPYFLFILWRKL